VSATVLGTEPPRLRGGQGTFNSAGGGDAKFGTEVEAAKVGKGKVIIQYGPSEEMEIEGGGGGVPMTPRSQGKNARVERF